jgi:hypothetical protein
MTAKSIINSTPELDTEGFSKTLLNINQAVKVSHPRKALAVINQFKPKIIF